MTSVQRSFAQVCHVYDINGKRSNSYTGLVYHSHFRPLTTPIATALDLSSVLHKNAPSGMPTPSSVLRSFASATSNPGVKEDATDLDPSPLASIANALTVPPIHVDHVAEAICKAVNDDSIEGIVDVIRMRELIGWISKGRNVRSSVSHG